MRARNDERRGARAKAKSAKGSPPATEACLRALRCLCCDSVTRLSPISFLAVFLALPHVLAAADRPQMVFSSEQPTYFDDRTKEMVGAGGAQMKYGDLLLTADVIRYNSQTRVAVAHGHAVLTQAARRLLADTITFHLNEGTYTVENLRLGEFPLNVTGASASGDRNTVTVNGAKATYREPGPFVPTVRADRLVYAPGQRMEADGAHVGIGGVRPFGFTLFKQNLKEPLFSYISLTGGYRSSLGAILEMGLHLPVAEGFKVGADVGIYTARGVMFGPSASYGSTQGDTNVLGYIRSGFISDHGDRLTDILGNPVPKNRKSR